MNGNHATSVSVPIFAGLRRMNASDILHELLCNFGFISKYGNRHNEGICERYLQHYSNRLHASKHGPGTGPLAKQKVSNVLCRLRGVAKHEGGINSRSKTTRHSTAVPRKMSLRDTRTICHFSLLGMLYRISAGTTTIRAFGSSHTRELVLFNIFTKGRGVHRLDTIRSFGKVGQRGKTKMSITSVANDLDLRAMNTSLHGNKSSRGVSALDTVSH